MGNQATPVIDAVQDFTLEKIILSGSPFVASILGPGAYLIAEDSAPLFYTNPVITGDLFVPTTLYCNEGSFNSSPRADLTYQWFYDDIPLNDETGITLEIDDSNVNTIITGNDVMNTFPTFSGSLTSHVRVDTLTLPPTTISAEIWIKTSGTNMEALFSYATATEFNSFTVFNAPALQVLINGSNHFTEISVNDGEWHHVALTWENANGVANLYVDGISRWSIVTQVGNSIGGDGILFLGQEQDAYGGDFDPNQTLDGSLCEFRVWDYVRSRSQIANGRFDQLVGDENGLVLYWRLDEGTGAVATDLSPSSKDGVYTDVTWTIEDGPVFIERIIVTNLGTDQPYHCEVTAINSTGSTVGVSNSLTLLLVTDTFVYTLDIMPIEGLNTPGRVDVNVIDASIISGFAHEYAISIDVGEPYIISGVAADARSDVNVGEPYIMTGMATLGAITSNIGEPYIITGVAAAAAESTNVAGAYAMFVPTLLTPLVVLNGDAENTDMSDWTMDTGDVTSETGGGWNVTMYREGLRYFHPADLGQGVDSQMSQVIDIPAGDWTDVDLGRCYCVARFLHLTNQNYDYLKVTLEALDAADAVLNTTVYNAPTQEPAEWWVRDTTIDDPLSLPTLTRKVKIIVLFDANASGSSPNSVYADDFHIELMKIE